MNTKKNLLSALAAIHNLATESYKELGPGFKEDTFQKALAISFRHAGIHYLKETNIEVFFKNESLGIFRLDFILLPQKHKDWRLSQPVIIETKVAPAIKNDARLQLKNYLLSIPLNNAPAINRVSEGIILNWRSNLDVSNEAAKEHVDVELWSMKDNKKIRKVYPYPPDED